MSFADVIGLASKYTVAQTLEREDFAQRLSTQKPIGLHEILTRCARDRIQSPSIGCGIGRHGSALQQPGRARVAAHERAGTASRLLMPLLVGVDGVQKMSKSLGNYIGINDAPDDMFGKVMSIPMKRCATTLCCAPMCR
jgi:tyrosyl-tRNA synthetase